MHITHISNVRSTCHEMASMTLETEAGAGYVAASLGIKEAFDEVKDPIVHLQEVESATIPPAVPQAPEQPLSQGASLRGHAFSLRVGYGNNVPRWKKGSILTFNADSSTFPSRQARSLAKTALIRAAKRWNAMDLGVTLKLAKVNEPAVFQLVYCPDIGTPDTSTYDGVFLAHSFPPDAPAEDRKLVVYASHFDPYYVDSMTNTFLHEIGHILGLRHEDEEADLPSVRFGPDNSKSIMKSPDHPRDLHIQETDVKWMQKFYAFSGQVLKGWRIIDVKVRSITEAW
ncbi:hypothetical protein N0V82_004857 [Gnomoniopsis sp. IMI 355080]|nr:hypothetical protein N0V82_004857 [Gnomoniopsis sp. IMI 355080]